MNKNCDMIHNVIVTKDNGTVLVAVYYDESSPAERGKFEHDLYVQTLPEWGEINPSKEMKEMVDEYKTHIALIGDKCVVYKKTNDVVFFITGTGAYSEFVRIVNDILSVIMNGFMAMCPKKKMNANAFVVDNTYGKMIAMLDQIVFGGQYCNSDIVTADDRAKMKAIK